MLDLASSTNLRSLSRPPDRASAFYHMYFFFELTTELAIPNVTNTGHFAHSPAARLIRSTWAKRESTNAANHVSTVMKISPGAVRRCPHWWPRFVPVDGRVISPVG